MRTHRITIIAMALAGFARALTAEEHISTTPVNDNPQWNVTVQKPETENTESETPMPLPTFAQPANGLLNELKVYPSF